MSLPLLVLCGGLATRLGKLTQSIPKSLIEIKGRPFIDWQLEHFKNQGILEVILCVGHLQEQIRSYAGDGRKYGLKISYSSDEDIQLGTGGALKGAMHLVGDDFIVTYGDSYLPTSFRKIVECYLSNNKIPLLAVCKQQYSWETPNVKWTDEKKIIYDKFSQDLSMKHIDYGLCVLNKGSLNCYSKNIPFDLAHCFNKLSLSSRLFGFSVADPYFEIGSLKGIESFTNFLKKRSM